MCIFILGLRLNPAWPLLVAANRDEYYERPTEPPHLLAHAPHVLGGRDVRAGGTWLGLNEHGLLVALTNRYIGNDFSQPRLPTSRGHLCLAALREPTPEAAVAAVRAALAAAAYNPFNLVAVSTHEAFCIMHAGDSTEWVPLETGWHIVANRRLDDPDDPRVQRARARLPTAPTGNAAGLLHLFAEVCRDHGEAGVPAGQLDCICQHRERSGTRSSSLLFADAAGRFTYLHAEGPPARPSTRRSRCHGRKDRADGPRPRSRRPPFTQPRVSAKALQETPVIARAASVERLSDGGPASRSSASSLSARKLP